MERHINNILVPIDFSEKSISALEQSFILAKLIDLEISLLHVIQDSGLNFFSSLFSALDSALVYLLLPIPKRQTQPLTLRRIPLARPRRELLF